MKRLLLLGLALFVLAASAPPIGVEKLYDSLLSYHTKRVNVNYRHETESEREARIRTIAEAIAKACEDFPLDRKLGWTTNQCIVLASTMAKWESGLIKEVHEGNKKGPAGELCLFQLHRGIANIPDPVYRTSEAERLLTVGTDPESTLRCATAGVKTIAWQIHRCSLTAGDFTAPAKMFEQYHWPDVNCTFRFNGMSSDRAASYRSLLAKLTAS